jgi:glutathione S-transferase
MKLYYTPASCSLASNITFAEAGLPYTQTRVDLATHTTEDGKDFYAIHDKGYVPYLELDNGQGLAEGAAILQYIADQKPDAKLAPANGTFERYKLQEWLTFINSEVHKPMGGLFDRSQGEDERKRGQAKVAKRLAWLNDKLAAKNFVFGDHFTIVDAYLWVVLNWGQWVGVDISAYPNVQSYFNGIAARPSVQAALKAVGLA